MGCVSVGECFNHDKHVDIYHEDGSCQHVRMEDSVYINEEIPFQSEAELAQILFNITKSNDEKCLVSGWANVAVNADGSLPLDWQDDIIPPDVLEKAAIDFMLNFRESGEMHQGNSKGIVVESIVFTKDKQEAIGIPEGTVPEGWFITVKILDAEVMNKVKNGTYKMFSIQGKAKRVRV